MSSPIAATPRVARRASYTPETVDLICRHIRETGIAEIRAALLAGVHPTTFRRWRFSRPELLARLAEARLDYTKSLQAPAPAPAQGPTPIHAEPPVAALVEPPLPAIVEPPTPKPLPKAGRPTLYTPELGAAICEDVRLHGWSDTRACLTHGVNPKNLPNWKAAHEDFAIGLEAARTDYLAGHVKAIAATETASGMTDWRARAWLLERQCPTEFGRRAPLKVDAAIEEVFIPEAELKWDGVITPRHLAIIQRDRQILLAAMSMKEAGAL